MGAVIGREKGTATGQGDRGAGFGPADRSYRGARSSCRSGHRPRNGRCGGSGRPQCGFRGRGPLLQGSAVVLWERSSAAKRVPRWKRETAGRLSRPRTAPTGERGRPVGAVIGREKGAAVGQGDRGGAFAATDRSYRRARSSCRSGHRPRKGHRGGSGRPRRGLRGQRPLPQERGFAKNRISQGCRGAGGCAANRRSRLRGHSRSRLPAISRGPGRSPCHPVPAAKRSTRPSALPMTNDPHGHS